MQQSNLFLNPQFIPERGIVRMTRGVGLAMDAEDRVQPDYCEALFACICQVAREQETVHIDDVLRRFSLKPHHPNANGGPWQRAQKQGIIVPSGRSRRCTVDAQKNAHDYKIYLSKIWRAA